MSAGGAGHVQSNFASDTRYRVRFYVFDGLGGSGSVDIFEAYGAETPASPLFKVSLDGGQFSIDASAASGGSTSVASQDGWNYVELDWTSGGDLRFWINSDAASDTGQTGLVSAGSGTVEAIRLGAPNGFSTQTGTLIFDAFESHRTTPIGMLENCDAVGNSGVDINDALAVVDEVFGNPSVLATGQPDCDSNGSIDINDVLAIVDIVF